MYPQFLHMHSILRWVVLILAVVCTVKYLLGFLGNKKFTQLDRKLGLFYLISVDIMLLLGLALYFLFSPSTQQAFANFGAAMKDPQLRFWAVEHNAMMIIAIILVHVGWAKIKKTDKTPLLRFRNGLIFFGLSLLLMLLGIPWAERGFLPH